MSLQRVTGARRVFGRAGADGHSRTPQGTSSAKPQGTPAPDSPANPAPAGGSPPAAPTQATPAAPAQPTSAASPPAAPAAPASPTAAANSPPREPSGPSGPSGPSNPSGSPSGARVSRGIRTTTDPSLSSTDRYRLGTWPANLHPELREFLDYWASKCGPQGQIPSRAQIDPSEIPSLLTGIALYDVERVVQAPGYRFKYRLLGTRHSAVNQADFAGRYVEEVHYPDEAIPIIGAFCLVAERKLPHYWKRERVSRRDPAIRIPYERIVVPLASDGVNVNMLFGHYVFHNTGDTWHWWRDSHSGG